MSVECEPVYRRVRRYVENAGLSRKIIAKNMGVSESQVSLLLNGRRQLKVDDYERLCRAIAVDPKHFFA